MGRPLSCDVLFSYRGSGYQFGCTAAALTAQRQLEHVKNALQNSMAEWTPNSVQTRKTQNHAQEFHVHLFSFVP